ncbi:MAG: hypothetical protein ACRDSR_13920 [Pseudonocardiaceae bacterium]
MVIEGADLPEGALFRPLDNALMIPGSFNGERIYFVAGEPVPPPPATARGPVAPTEALPPTLSSELNRAGSFSGHPLAAGGTSAVLVLALDTGIYVLTRGEMPPPEHVLHAAESGGVAGAVAEQAAAGADPSARTGFGAACCRPWSGAAGGVGGAVAGPLVETMMLALDDRQHTRGEYASAAGRGAVAGAAGGLVGAALTGALAGSVAPGVGTAIGFVASPASGGSRAR